MYIFCIIAPFGAISIIGEPNTYKFPKRLGQTAIRCGSLNFQNID